MPQTALNFVRLLVLWPTDDCGARLHVHMRARTQGGSPKDPWIKNEHRLEYLDLWLCWDVNRLSKAIDTADNLPLADLLQRLSNLLRIKVQEERKQVSWARRLLEGTVQARVKFWYHSVVWTTAISPAILLNSGWQGRMMWRNGRQVWTLDGETR